MNENVYADSKSINMFLGVKDCPQGEDEICTSTCGTPQKSPLIPQNTRIVGGTEVRVLFERGTYFDQAAWKLEICVQIVLFVLL